MKILKSSLLVLTLTLLILSGAAAFCDSDDSDVPIRPTSEANRKRLEMRLIPIPKTMTLGDGTIALDDSLELTVAAADPAAAGKIVEKFFPRWFEKTPIVKTEKVNGFIPIDGYRIRGKEGKIRIAASNTGGVLNALKTLRQLAEPNRRTETLEYYFVPEMEIDDAPGTAFRGLHLCWFPETDPVRIEQAIRMAAYYKFNYLILEPWGTYRYEKRPDFCWSEFAVDKKEIRRLVEIGRNEGIRLIPQLNVYGHASASRGMVGKHATLDFAPQYQPLFEPDGWAWCLSNPKTEEVLTDMVLDLYDAFDSPPFFHLGCDEACAGACSECFKTNAGILLLNHLTYFCDLLTSRGCRPMIWHDMFIKPEGAFKGYVANGNDKFAAVLGRLPKEIIICDWQYSAPKENETWPTMLYFKEKGFDVVAASWNETNGTLSQGELVRREHLFGILDTTWHHFKGAEMRSILAAGASAGWGTDWKGGTAEIHRHLRQIGSDMPVNDYRHTGVDTWQVEPEPYGR